MVRTGGASGLLLLHVVLQDCRPVGTMSGGGDAQRMCCLLLTAFCSWLCLGGGRERVAGVEGLGMRDPMERLQMILVVRPWWRRVVIEDPSLTESCFIKDVVSGMHFEVAACDAKRSEVAQAHTLFEVHHSRLISSL